MKNPLSVLTPVLAGLLLFLPGAAWLAAQVTNPIRAHVDHSFVIGDKTLPAGDYTFRIEGNSDSSVMTATSGDGKIVAQFNVRQAMDDHRPHHSELVFRKYGDTEFLSKIFEAGSKSGVALTETSKAEARLVGQGQRAAEHSEEQR
jgi:hypothetical protein